MKRQASFEIKAREIEAKLDIEEKRELKMRQAFHLETKQQNESSESEDTQGRHFEDSQRSRKHVDGEIQEKFEIYSISGKLI